MGREIAPGREAPAIQGPLETVQPLTLPAGLENPQVVPNASPNGVTMPPGRLLDAMPPLGSPINISQLTPQSPSEGAPAFNAANMEPLVARAVLARGGPNGVSWAAPVAIAGQTSVNVRGAYRDLKITPGFRGLQIQYPTGTGVASITENITGMVYTLPTGPQTIFVPLFMSREFFDLTISFSGSGGFPAGSTCLLTTEEQIPVNLEGGGGGGGNVTVGNNPVGSGAFATSQAAIGAAALIVAARTGAAGTGRIAATLYNTGSQTVYVGATSGVTSATGLPLVAGGSLTINTQTAIYGVAASGTQTIGVLESY